MSDLAKAVFLSYASQDAEAAKRICEALRAAGVEVWFDQSELVGGDAWDQKIRKQIKECALLIPVISATTQARTEGYFRLEWRLADQRTHLMAKGRPFLLPVVIDDTRDSEAQVPDSFTEVQWTRLPGGAGAEKFSERVKKLLSGGGTSSPSTPLGTLSPSKGRESGSHAPIPASPEHSPPRITGRRWLIPAILGVVAVIAVAVWFTRTSAPSNSGNSPEPRTQTQNPPPAVPTTEARQLVERARGLMDKVNVLPGDLNTAAGMLEQAAQLAPNDALVWSTWALLDLRYVSLDYDNTPSRHNAARAHLAQANALDPASRETRYTQAEVMRSLAWDPATQAAAEKILRPMLTEAPEDGRVPIQLGWVAFAQGRLDDAVAHFERAALLPASAVHATYCKALVLGLRNHFEACDRALDQLLVLAPTHAFGLCQKAAFSMLWHGDPDAARDYIERIPPQMRVEDMSASFAYGVYMTRREYDLAVQAIRAVPRDYLSAQPGPGPSGFYIGEALAAAGKNAAAEIEWRSALATVERRLAEAPSDEALMKFKALLLARLGARVAAERVWKAVVELHGDRAWGNMAPLLHVVFLPPDEVIAWLNGRFEDPQYWFTAESLRLLPVYDPLRSNPKFTALVEKMEADPRFSPKAKPPSAPAPISQLPSPSDQPKVDQKSVAVLAFANLSDDKANEYFSDGISEELLNVLAKVPGLKVTARTSSFHFKGKDTPIPEIAKQLGVAYVVEGSVRKQGEKVRINAQLIKAADGFRVWSENFNRDLKDIFAVQDEIAGLIAQQLSLKLGTSSAASTVAVKPEAFELYVQARRAWNLRSAAGFAQAEELLTRALMLEPDFARAHVALADVWMLRAIANGVIGAFGQREAPIFNQITSEIQKALAQDPDSSEARASLGLVMRMQQWDLTRAERELRRAVELNPNYATAHHWLGNCLIESGRIDEGVAELQRAAELDPFSPRILQTYAKALVWAGHHQEALAVLSRAEALQPRAPQTLLAKAEALLRQGHRAEAMATARQLEPEDRAELLARAGEKAEAEAALAETEGWSQYKLLVALGRTAEALANLRAEDVNASDVGSWLLDPRLDPFRSDRHFTGLLATLGLTEAHARVQAWRAAQPAGSEGQTSHGSGRATGPGSAAPRQARGLEPVETAADNGKAEDGGRK